MQFKFAYAAAAAVLMAGQATASDYSIDDLTARYGAGIKWSYINNSGELMGLNQGYGLELRLRTGSVTLAPAPGILGMFPQVLGNDGTAYLMRQTPMGDYVMLSRSPDGALTTVPGLPNSRHPTGSVSDVNDYGIAAGYAKNSSGDARAAIFQGGKAIELGAPGYLSYAEGINNHGAVVGTYRMSYDSLGAFMYANGQITTIGGAGTSVIDINDANVVAGSQSFRNYSNAFLYENGTMTYISIAGRSGTTAIDLNNSGVLLGQASNFNAPDEYFLYSQGTTIMLNDILAAEGYAGWSISYATDINDNGQILAHALNDVTGETRELLLNPALPVPEPATWAMLLAGLGCVGMLKRRARAA